MSARVHVVRTGTANLASVLAALGRLGVQPVLTDEATEVVNAERLVVPGVGAFGACMATLRQRNLVAPLKQRVLDGQRATLGVCMGMQVFCDGSEESPDVPGLGAVSGHLRRFASMVRVPQLGWNEVQPHPGCQLLTSGYAYFANSYRLEAVPPGWRGAITQHGGPFVAALERGPMLLCQFHPELSGSFGAALLDRWMACN